MGFLPSGRGGWCIVNHVLPFGWKISPNINQSLGMVATQEIRSQGLQCCQDIDERHLGLGAARSLEQTDTQILGPSCLELVAAASHVVVYLNRPFFHGTLIRNLGILDTLFCV